MQKLNLRMQKLNLRMQKLNFLGTHWRGLAWIGAKKNPEFDISVPNGSLLPLGRGRAGGRKLRTKQSVHRNTLEFF